MYNKIGDFMFNNMENVKLINIISDESCLRNSFKFRFSHAFVFKISGESIYNFKNCCLSLKQGEMLFIPKGSSYDVQRISDISEYVLINFDADISNPVPMIYSVDNYPEQGYIYHQLAKMWLFGGETGKFKCYSVFYNVLAFLSTKENPEYSYIKKFKVIEKAINYLHSNIFNCDLKVGDLHLICGISDTYFRKIFKAYFGVTPQEYVMNKRMSQASNIITSGEYNLISEVALSVGYSDALYFSRIFLKKYGFRPSEFLHEKQLEER